MFIGIIFQKQKLVNVYFLFTTGGDTTPTFPPGSGPIFVDSLICNEESQTVIGDCVALNDIGLTDCSHQDDIGVQCEGVLANLVNLFVNLQVN